LWITVDILFQNVIFCKTREKSVIINNDIKRPIKEAREIS
jgi:hypothetical protein